MEEERSKVRVVRCPKCDKLLPELANFSVYRCGGCNATLQAKKQIPTSEASSEKSNGEIVKYIENTESCSENKGMVVSDASSECDPKGDRVDLRKEEKKLSLNESPNSDGSLMATSEYKDVAKESETTRLDALLPMESGTEGRESKYRHSSKAPLDITATDVDNSVKAKVEERREAKVPLEKANGYHRVQPRQAWRDEDRERTSAFRRPVPYPDEGPSNYHRNTAKKRNLDDPNSAEFPDQERAELLRKLDELRDQLKRSCEVAEKPKERTPTNRTTFSSNPYNHNNRGNWFPEGSSSLNRASSQHSPFMNGHSMDIPNLYPGVHPQNGVFGLRELYGPQSLGRAPFHPSGQYPQRPMNNYLCGQFDPDPLVSYHHDGFYHQPACSCLHCYNTHWPTVYNNQRVPYPVNNHGFYPVDGPSAFGPQTYNQRDANIPLNSHEPRARQRATIAKKDGRPCRAVAGAAPFVSCYNCFELLQLPEDFSRTGKKKHKLRCGSCSQIISFELDGRRLAPAPITNLTPENENSKDEMNGDMNRPPSNSYSGDFDCSGYEVHSADEKLVLPSFPVSRNEMIEKEYGFHLNESEKMQGISSSPSISDDVDSPDSLSYQRDMPSSTELPLDAEGISRVPSLPLREHFGYPLSNQVIDGSGNGSRSRRSDQEKILSVNGIYKQSSVKEIPVATEMDLSVDDDDFPDAGLSQESWEVSHDEDQPRAKNSKSGDSFFAGLIKKSFKFNQSMEGGRCKVSINGHPISDRLVKKAEKQAGPVHPGDYWYDYRAGFWGVIGHPCLGIIPPFIEEFNYPMPKNCASGNTGVLVNGRELHHKDLTLLSGRGLPATEGRSYIIEISGKVWDEASGEELDSLGKLAPTIEKVKHGFGMRVPRLIA